MFFKCSLKRRIQNSMFYTACIALLITMLFILPLMFTISLPLSSYVSNSVNNSIIQGFITKFETEFERARQWENTADVDNISVEELTTMLYSMRERSNTESKTDATPIETIIENQADPDIYIDQLDESAQKHFILSALNILHEIETLIPLREFVEIDFILTEFKVKDEIVFAMPQDADDDLNNGIAYYESLSLEAQNLKFMNRKLLGIYNHTKSTLRIYNDSDELVGTIITSINPVILYYVMTPVIAVFVFSGIIALFIAMLMSKLLSIPILKPIKLLNQQFAAIAVDDYAFGKDLFIELRRPPNEIRELRDNANRIMKKMSTYFENLEDYKDELEAQNAELEAQNIELSDSKHVIEKQQDQLVQSEKMASIGQLSAAIAHEINTPLGVIKSNCQMAETLLPMVELKLDTEADAKTHKALKNLKNTNAISLDAAKRMGEIIRNLKNFSRLDQSDYQEADINEGIQSVLVLTSNLWKNKINLKEHYGTLPPVRCYPSMLNQVIMNILVNAIHASDKNGLIEIETHSDDTNVTIAIKDYGIGMSEDVVAHVFDSGFTTKEKNEGTGLGLSISHDIIERHQGRIEVESTLGEGALFKVILPINHESNE